MYLVMYISAFISPVMSGARNYEITMKMEVNRCFEYTDSMFPATTPYLYSKLRERNFDG